MMYFTLFVCIANLALGFATAWLCRWHHESLSAGDPSHSAAPQPGRGPAEERARPALPTPATAAARAPQAAAARESREPAKATQSRPKSWADLKADLQTLLDRASYSRSANDKRLACETAGQLREFAESWCAALQPWLVDRDAAGDSLPGGEVAATEVEMWVAQLETTLRNLGEMDPAEPTDAVLDRLDRELAAVKRNSPRACKSVA
ncbi:MAG: hypothetical protein SFU86_08200 [Pirellulaceae bacterium]|nr:hypothetical protein [Pirellulaceae bacterium]